ncbi:OB-fold nucleic acid binding domain-containing protein [Hydrogenimonas sp.]
MKKLFLLWLTLFSLTLAGANISAKEAARHVGEYVVVCGEVSGVYYARHSNGAPTFVNLDGRYPHQAMTLVIWQEDRPDFPSLVSNAAVGKRVCVEGVVELYRGKPEIVLRERSQLR